jgi:hypothetical protein
MLPPKNTRTIYDDGQYTQADQVGSMDKWVLSIYSIKGNFVKQ